MTKGHCKGEEGNVVETKFSPFSNQKFDISLIECYVHEIEGHYFERNFIKDILNWTKSAISRKIHIWPTDNLDKSRTWQHRICSLMPLGFLKQIFASTLVQEGT